ncbi:CaiD Enoyl-CoA hydratase/carnithine racemase [Burkholderiaceae bacterium]
MLNNVLINGVLTLTINRALAANALNLAVYEAMHEALTRAASQDEVKVLVITGVGTRAFCSGVDLKEVTELSASQASQHRLELLLRCFLELLDFSKPVIAVVQAPAVGAGLMLAAICDEVLMADHAWVSLPEVKLDMPTPIGAALISARANRSLCHKLVQLGERVSALECLQSGLAERIVPAVGLSELCLQRAQVLAEIPAYGYAVNKKWMNRDVRTTLLEAGQVAAEAHRRHDKD